MSKIKLLAGPSGASVTLDGTSRTLAEWRLYSLLGLITPEPVADVHTIAVRTDLVLIGALSASVIDLGEFEGFSPGDVRNYVTSALQLAVTGLSQAVRL